MQGLSDDDLVRLNIDPAGVISIVSAALPAIRAMRPEVAKMPHFDLASFDSLKDYLDALLHAQSDFIGGASEPDDVGALYDEALTLRDVMLADARLLVKRGHVDAEKLTGLTSSIGFRNVANDLLWLSRIAREVGVRTTVTDDEIEHARQLSAKLLLAAGTREQGLARRGSPADMRLRAFTLLVRAYDEARAAIVYLRRRYGDGDRIAPSIYLARASRKKSPAVGGNGGDATAPNPPPATAPTSPPEALEPASSTHASASNARGLSEDPNTGGSSVH